MLFSYFCGQKQAGGAIISVILTPRPKRGLASEILDPKVKVMAWTSPVFEEVVLCCEINSYVSAKL
jgi:hypothetical protein